MNIHIYIYIFLLGSKTLGTKCIRTSLCICWQTMIKTMSLGLGVSLFKFKFESSVLQEFIV